MEIKLTPEAKGDLLDISIYLKERFPDKATTTYQTITASFLNLADYPELGQITSFSDIRSLKVGRLPYFIIYRVKKDYISVLRIYHTSRKPLN